METAKYVEALLFGNLLVEEVCSRKPEADFAREWEQVLKVALQFPRTSVFKGHADLRRARLAFAAIVVGAQRVDQFQEALSYVSEWAKIGGCYWICVEELLRHIILHQIQEVISEYVEDDVEKLCARLQLSIERVFENLVPSLQGNGILEIRLPALRIAFEEFLIVLANKQQSSEKQFKRFAQQTPLTSFSAWFVRWAQSILHKTENMDTICARSKTSWNLDEEFEVVSGISHAELEPEKTDNVKTVNPTATSGPPDSNPAAQLDPNSLKTTILSEPTTQENGTIIAVTPPDLLRRTIQGCGKAIWDAFTPEEITAFATESQ